jgi:small subunit ribosomal protein S16
MLAIRLSRTGARIQAHYRVVVCETRTAAGSSVIEVLGHYNPRTVPATIRVNQDRVAHWIGAGARPSATVRSLLAGQAAGQPEAAAAETPRAGAL